MTRKPKPVPAPKRLGRPPTGQAKRRYTRVEIDADVGARIDASDAAPGAVVRKYLRLGMGLPPKPEES